MIVDRISSAFFDRNKSLLLSSTNKSTSVSDKGFNDRPDMFSVQVGFRVAGYSLQDGELDNRHRMNRM